MPPNGITIQQWGFDVHKPDTVLGPRILPDFDFVWIIDGEIEWEWDQHRHIAPAGSLLLARRGMGDTIRWNRQIPTRNFFLHFHLPPQDHLPAERTWPLICRLPDGDIARPMLRHLAWVLEHKPRGWEALAALSVQHLVTAFVLGALGTTEGQQARLDPVIERFISHVTDHWDRLGKATLGLDELARAVEISRETLCRVFRREIGCPPIEALRLIRLERAATILRGRTRPIAEVATLAGFPDQFHFSRRFTSAFACSPSDYRRRFEQGTPPALDLPPGVQSLARRFLEELGNPE